MGPPPDSQVSLSYGSRAKGTENTRILLPGNENA